MGELCVLLLNHLSNSGKWSEVLTTAIDYVAQKLLNKDAELLELFAQIVKDGGK